MARRWSVGRSFDKSVCTSVDQSVGEPVHVFQLPLIQSEYTRQFYKGFVLGCLDQNMTDDLISIQITQSQRIIDTSVSENFFHDPDL